MNITLIQCDIAWNAPEENRKAMERMIMEAERSDLYVLPEMWATGFIMEPETMMENADVSLKWMQRMADTTGGAIAGSLAVRMEDGTYRNRFYFVKPGDGEHCAYYDKHHLFSYGGEDRNYSRGMERTVVEWRGVKFLLQVCYDMRFPEWARNHDDYDCILYCASWPDSRQLAWHTLLRARAIENQCYVCGVNRVGTDPICNYIGGTAMIHPYGHAVAEAENGRQQSVTGFLDMEKLVSFRMKFPVLADRD